MERLKKASPEQAIKPKGDFSKYLDTRFTQGTSQKLEGLLVREMKSLANTKPDKIINPDLRLSLRNAEYIVIFGAGENSNLHTQETLEASEKKVNGMLEKNYLPTELATAYFVITGEKCWSDPDNRLMKKDLGKKIDGLLNSGNGTGLPADNDQRYGLAAGYAATYKLLFNEKSWSLKQEEKMLDVTEQEFDRFNKEEKFLSNNTVALSSRAATIKVLGDFS